MKAEERTTLPMPILDEKRSWDVRSRCLIAGIE